MTAFPVKSKSFFTDFKHFILNKPPVDSWVKIDTAETREDFDRRILQRTGYETENFHLLNIHKISIDCPVEYVFEEILRWNWKSDCWPNHIARFVRRNGEKNNVSVYLFRPFTTKKRAWGFRLFNLRLIKKQEEPLQYHPDNARYLMYESSGGYPIGLFSIYARNSVTEMNESGMTQLFFVVGFDFFGRKFITKIKFIRAIWEGIHNRVTANILNRFKQLCEATFERHDDIHLSSKQSFSDRIIS